MDLHWMRLDTSIIPNIPFLWYREEELICPIEYIGKTKHGENDMYIVIQRNILKNANIYVCNHSYMYYLLNKDIERPLIPIEIPTTYLMNKHFDVKLTGMDGDNIIYTGGLVHNIFKGGSVFIHGGAFSPSGCFQFKVNNDRAVNKFLSHSICREMKCGVQCLFILLNDNK